jgi:hypothetical protein
MTLPNRCSGQLVAPFVLLVASMSWNPLPRNSVSLTQGQEFFPKIPVDYGLLLAVGPVPGNPPPDPLSHALDYVAGIRDHFDPARLLEKAQAFNNPPELHAIVCSPFFTAGNLPSDVAVSEYGPISARARIPAASSIGKNFNYLFPICGHHLSLHLPVPRVGTS